MIDLRCSARTEDEIHRCQLLAGHGAVHAALLSVEGHRRILTWMYPTPTTQPGDLPGNLPGDLPAELPGDLPADSGTASRFAWAPGCPTIEDMAGLRADAAKRRKRHLRVVA